ncbi:MAG: thiol oxidoreductase, partial [Acidobacteria bacterium]|nr:thiol oxidoreductase [Acidobacteriota bacterium]
DGDGISGRLQRIPGPTGSRVGRFGWKAAQPDLESQIARAFHEDMGVTSRRYPEANCPTGDEACLLQEGQEIELTDSDLHLVALYARLLAPPARRDWQDPAVLRGRDLFVSTGCSDCHRTELETAAVERAAENPSEARERSTPPPQPEILPELAGQTIRPFTDLLLHDMGPELADGIVEHSASASEWRTAPLWGLGLLERVNGHLRLLHDGRARTVEEAILWHGGEGAASREAYTQLPDDRRAALLQFLRSL